ncbi:MAG TPA: N-acetylmuramoyl-L-alanine amidase [Casimicrobiaceae bacterium]|nr:N-acetylmuramoyl-L-alanine amidase [Casimicrobiaceae bacterium]
MGGFSAAPAAELRAIALSANADSAQVTLDLSGGTAQKLFTLDHPDRVVIDLPHTERGSGVHAPAGSGVVSELRLGTQPHGTLRVVVQLKSALPAHSTWGASVQGRRLIVSLGQPLSAAVVEEAPKAVRAAHAVGDGDRDVVIAVDAGHGGDDPGAIGHGGTREKDVTLAIARALAARIDAEGGMRAVLTRDRDQFLELRERIRRAHAYRADMFVSVHADSIADRSVSGASVYVLSAHGASSEAARLLAERENAADLMGGVLEDKGELRPVLLDAAQSEIIGLSATAAERVVLALSSVGELRRREVQQAGFVVLKSPDMPSMLVETAYISNPVEERRLRSLEQQERLADAIASGVRSYFLQNPPDGTRFKQERRTLASAAQASTSATP